jgi:hypothetical protein
MCSSLRPGGGTNAIAEVRDDTGMRHVAAAARARPFGGADRGPAGGVRFALSDGIAVLRAGGADEPLPVDDIATASAVPVHARAEWPPSGTAAGLDKPAATG